MSTPYPDLPQLIGSEIAGDDGTTVERAVSGKVRMRSLYVDVQLIATILHEVDGPDKELVMAHYAANRGEVFPLLYRADGLTYQLMYTGMPRCIPVAGTDRWSITSSLVSA